MSTTKFIPLLLVFFTTNTFSANHKQYIENEPVKAKNKAELTTSDKNLSVTVNHTPILCNGDLTNYRYPLQLAKHHLQFFGAMEALEIH